MSLNSLVIATHGVGLTPIAMAVQGLVEFISGGGTTIFQDTDQGIAPTNQRNYYVERLNAEFERKSRIKRDNALATAFIMALLQMEMLDG